MKRSHPGIDPVHSCCLEFEFMVAKKIDMAATQKAFYFGLISNIPLPLSPPFWPVQYILIRRLGAYVWQPDGQSIIFMMRREVLNLM